MITMYVVSLVMMQGVTSELQRKAKVTEWDTTTDSFWGCLDDADEHQVMTLYSSILRTMLTLFMTISGGMEWSAAAEPAAKLDSYLGVVWCAYMSFMLYGLLNVLVSILVGSAMQAIQNDSYSSMAAEFDDYAMFSDRIEKIFRLADANKDNCLDWNEFQSLRTDPGVVAMLHGLGIANQVDGLFKYLDDDKNGTVSLDEFKQRLWRLRGNATAIDVLMLMQEHRMVSRKINEIHRHFDADAGHLPQVVPATLDRAKQLGVPGSMPELPNLLTGAGAGAWLKPWNVQTMEV